MSINNIGIFPSSKLQIREWGKQNGVSTWPRPYVLLTQPQIQHINLMFPRDGVKFNPSAETRFYIEGAYEFDDETKTLNLTNIRSLYFMGDALNSPMTINLQNNDVTIEGISYVPTRHLMFTPELGWTALNQSKQSTNVMTFITIEPMIHKYSPAGFVLSRQVLYDMVKLPEISLAPQHESQHESQPNTESIVEAVKKVVNMGPNVIARAYGKAFGLMEKPPSKTRSPELKRKFPSTNGGKRKTKRRNNKPKKINRKSKKAKAIHKNMKRSRSKTRKMKKTSSRK
jgi:hypothetical protein